MVSRVWTSPIVRVKGISSFVMVVLLFLKKISSIFHGLALWVPLVSIGFLHLKFFWYFQTAQFPSLGFCACCRHLKFDYEDPDKAERMLIRAARFGNQLQSPSRRKQTLTLTINTMSVCLPSLVCLWLCEHQKHKLHEKKDLFWNIS